MQSSRSTAEVAENRNPRCRLSARDRRTHTPRKARRYKWKL